MIPAANTQQTTNREGGGQPPQILHCSRGTHTKGLTSCVSGHVRQPHECMSARYPMQPPFFRWRGSVCAFRWCRVAVGSCLAGRTTRRPLLRRHPGRLPQSQRPAPTQSNAGMNAYADHDTWLGGGGAGSMRYRKALCLTTRTKTTGSTPPRTGTGTEPGPQMTASTRASCAAPAGGMLGWACCGRGA